MSGSEVGRADHRRLEQIKDVQHVHRRVLVHGHQDDGIRLRKKLWRKYLHGTSCSLRIPLLWETVLGFHVDLGSKLPFDKSRLLQTTLQLHPNQKKQNQQKNNIRFKTIQYNHKPLQTYPLNSLQTVLSTTQNHCKCLTHLKAVQPISFDSFPRGS